MLEGLGDCPVIRLLVALGEWKSLFFFFFLDNKKAEQDEVEQKKN